MNKLIKRIYLILFFIFLYAPILVLIVNSFNQSKLTGNWGGFTTQWYSALINDREVLRALYVTIMVALIATVVSTIMGTLAAIGISGFSKRNRNIILGLNNIPVLNPDIVTAISLMVLFGSIKLRFGYLTLILSHIVFTTPYVILSVLPKLKQMDRNLAEAAMDLGATPMYTLRKVIIPEIKPGIVSGALMAFTLSIDDFIISFFTTGQGIANISTLVYSMARRGINPVINAMSTLMFAVMLLLLFAINKRTIKENNK